MCVKRKKEKEKESERGGGTAGKIGPRDVHRTAS